ncbi:MAG: histidine kinase [Chitinophagales bacterium]|nr:histidine kinase [Chitinophagales bacterium]
MTRKLLILFLLSFKIIHLQAEDLLLDDKFIMEDGNKYVEYYLSTDTSISPNELYHQMRSSEYMDVKRYLFFTTQSEKWMLLNIKNQLSQPFDFLIELESSGLSKVDYYIFQQDSMLAYGSLSSRKDNKVMDYYDRNIVIPYTATDQDRYSILMKLETNAPIFNLPIVVWNKSSRFSIGQGLELGRGLFYGVLLFFIISTGIVIFLIKDRSYFFFWLYIFIGGLLLLMKSGIPLEVFWPGRTYLNFVISNFILYAYLLVSLRFLRDYLSNKFPKGWYSLTLDIFMVIGLLLFILYLPFTFFNVFLQDTLLIVQFIYVNLTNLLVITLLFIFLPKVEDKFVLIASLLYFLLFSTYLFNPFIQFKFWTAKHFGHLLLYTGGVTLSALIAIVSYLRMRTVIKSNRQLKFEMQKLNKRYSHSLVQGQEKQRKMVAEELHDGIGAYLSSIKIRLSGLKPNVKEREKVDLLNRISDNLDEVTQKVRALSHELMPPVLNRYGLNAAVEDMIQNYQNDYPITITFKSNLKQYPLDKTSENITYRILHQLLNTLIYTHTQKADIKIVVLPSISTSTIQVKYSGGHPITQNEKSEFSDLKALINLLQGKIESLMSNIWDDELRVEYPIETV